MRKTIEIVDDFHAEPLRVRESALRLSWRSAEADDPLAGSTWVADAAIDDAAARGIGRLLGTADQGGPVRTIFTAAGENPAAPDVTTLHRPGWGAIVWLCLPEECQGGISFHQPRDAAGRNGDADRPDVWEETMFVPARFNRLVLFASEVAYRCGPGFGRSPDTSALTQFLLVDPMPAK